MSQAAVTFVQNLVSAAANAPLYGASHPHLRQLLEVAHLSLQQSLEVSAEIAIDVVGNEIIINGNPQPFNIYLSRCAALLSSRGISLLRFRSGVSLQELTALIMGLTLPLEKGGRILSSENIRLGRERAGVEMGERRGAGALSAGSLPATSSLVEELEQRDHEVSREMREAVRRRGKLELRSLSSLVSTMTGGVFGGDNALPSAALNGWLSHEASVTILTLTLAKAAGATGPLLHDIGCAAMLHDIGKLFLPEEVLAKRHLDRSEIALVREHPVRGARFLLDTPGVPRVAILAAFEHHLNFDLSGYPAVRAGWKMNPCSHMVAVANMVHRNRADVIAGTGWSTLFGMMGKELHPVYTRMLIAELAGSGRGGRAGRPAAPHRGGDSTAICIARGLG